MRITLRNFILHRLIGVPRVLNTSASGASGTSQTIAADLKRAIQKLDTSGAQVDYAHVRASPGYADYRTQVAALRVFDLASLPTRADRIAFWLNLYNALVIDAVIAFGVQRSVTERQGGIGFFLRAAYNIGGQVYSLHDIEHGVLRENRGYPAFAGRQFAASDPRRPHVIDPMDVRIHFALNCASRSCPPINVYDAEKLDKQLDLATRNFVDSEVQLDPNTGSVQVSRIFQWYQGDFGGESGVIAFIARYLPDDDPRRRALQGNSAVKLTYAAYDWALNQEQTTL
jgi:hypothetical protein